MAMRLAQDFVQRGQDVGDSPNGGVVNQPVTNLAVRGPAGSHTVVRRQGPHLGEGDGSEVLEDGITVTAFGRAVSLLAFL